MKLAEALQLRGDLQKRMMQLSDRLMQNARVQEGEKPAEAPEALLAEYECCAGQLEELMARLSPAVFFSGELCARYFTYMSRDNGAHFVLFDDGDTLRHKVEVARELGIRTFLAPWAEVAPHAARIGILRKPEPRQGRR